MLWGRNFHWRDGKIKLTDVKHQKKKKKNRWTEYDRQITAENPQII